MKQVQIDPVELFNETVRDVLQQAGSYTLQEVAERVIDLLGEQALLAWFKQTKQAVVAEVIRSHHHAVRNRALRDLQSEQRYTALTSFVRDGSEHHLAPFRDVRYAIPQARGNPIWKRLGDMTGPDHEALADSYGIRAKRNAVRESLHRAVAKQVGDKRTEEVFTEGQYKALFGRYVNEPISSELEGSL